MAKSKTTKAVIGRGQVWQEQSERAATPSRELWPDQHNQHPVLVHSFSLAPPLTRTPPASSHLLPRHSQTHIHAALQTRPAQELPFTLARTESYEAVITQAVDILALSFVLLSL